MNVCEHHSGLVSKIEDHEKDLDSINACIADLKKQTASTKNWIIATLTGVILTLLGVLFSIVR